mmetsp:Transcript_71472/g.113681  ORF Transcript_71472/g.113681 Transcript_71472/m.113681 type:complete len:138 (+) Transcript_71472:79-492(+)
MSEAVATKYCISCGNQLPVTANFCSQCGSQQQQVPTATATATAQTQVQVVHVVQARNCRQPNCNSPSTVECQNLHCRKPICDAHASTWQYCGHSYLYCPDCYVHSVQAMKFGKISVCVVLSIMILGIIIMAVFFASN